MTEFNVLSLFDGISCGQIALNRVGIKYDRYFASEIDKNAIKVTQDNYPNTIQIGDVTKVRGQDLPKISLLLGGSPCFSSGSLVLTDKGYAKIENIQVGDMVMTHKNRFRKVLSTGGQQSEIWTIKGMGTPFPIRTTKDHPFLTKEMTRRWDNKQRTYKRVFSEDSWKSVEDISGDLYWNMPCSTKTETFENYDFWYLIGRYTGDGWYRKSKRKHRKNSYIYQFIICCGKHEFYNLKSKFDNAQVKYNYSEERTGFKFRVCSQKLVYFVEPIGKGASNKRVHPYLFKESDENIKAFLCGYHDSDGNTSKRGEKKITSTSYELLLGVQYLINKTKKRPCTFLFQERPKTCTIEGRLVNQKPTFHLKWTEERRKQDKAFHDGHSCWLPIKEVKNTKTFENVYNIEVEEDNSYTISNIAVHNCQGFSFAGKQLNFQDPRSKLFFEYARLLKELREENSNMLFLLENVKMKKEHQDVISEILGVQPVTINSSKLSAQNRVRIYWHNIPNFTMPEDKGIMLKDVINQEYDGIWVWPRGANKGGVQSYKGKSPSLTTSSWQHNFLIYKNDTKNGLKIEGFIDSNSQGNRVYSVDGKSSCLNASSGGLAGNGNSLILVKDKVRKFTVEEAEALQTVPRGYTKAISDNQRFKCLGNGWTVDVIAHILKGITQ